MKNAISFMRFAALAGLALPALAAGGPAAFEGRLGAGESAVVQGSVVTVGPGALLAPGSRLVIRATDGVVFTPGADFSAGSLDAEVSGGAELAKPAAPALAIESFAASLARTPDGFVLRYALPKAGRVQVRLLDAQGKTVFKSALGMRPAGRHEQNLRPALKRSGLYLMRAEFAGSSVTQRMPYVAR